MNRDMLPRLAPSEVGPVGSKVGVRVGVGVVGNIVVIVVLGPIRPMLAISIGLKLMFDTPGNGSVGGGGCTGVSLAFLKAS